MGPIFVVCGAFLLIQGEVILWMSQLSVSERMITLSKFVLVEDVHSVSSCPEMANKQFLFKSGLLKTYRKQMSIFITYIVN